MAKVITVHSEKGGVGKSTLVFNLSACLGKNHKVCVVDLDGQSSVTKGFGVETEETIYNILSTGNVTPVSTNYNVDIIAGDGGVFLQKEAQQVDCLNDIFATLRENYDYILVDTAPSLTPLNISAYCNSDYILVAALYEIGALDGVRGVQDNLKGLHDNFGCKAEMIGVSLQRFNARRNIHKILSKLYSNEFGNKLMKVIIPECTAVSESYLVQEPVITYSPKCKATDAYLQLTKELLKRIKDNK